MKGSIYKRSLGSWTIVYDLPVDSVTGKRRQKSQTIKGTKRHADLEIVGEAKDGGEAAYLIRSLG